MSTPEQRAKQLAYVKKHQRENRDRYLELRRAARARRVAARPAQPFACVFCAASFPSVLSRGVHEGTAHPGLVPAHRAEREIERERTWRQRDDVRARTREANRGNPKRLARLAVWRAVREGRLTRTACIACFATPVEGHHHLGYDRPLDVQWLCIPHHKAVHRMAAVA